MFKEFIKAYKEAYFKEFSSDFYGRFKRFAYEITAPCFHPSRQLEKELQKLDLFIDEPVQIAIVGQFSSGKSTFLNAILGREILPSGVTPVTARLTHVKYGQSYALRVDYKNGKELNLGVERIADFVDQRVFTDDVERLCIYAPSPILKRVNFIDTPGLNSLSSSDTKITEDALENVGAVVWLSLAQNAARASELKDLAEFLRAGDKIAICALNQKDKLSADELERVLDHTQKTLGENFKRIVAISAKQACEAARDGDEKLMAQSGFSEILSAVENEFTGEDLKRNFVRKRCEKLVSTLAAQYDFFAYAYGTAAKILTNFDENLTGEFELLRAKFNPKIEVAFNEIKQIAQTIADEIIASLRPKSASRFESKSALLGGEKIKRVRYEVMRLDADEVFTKLIYNDVKLAKFFRIYRRNLTALQDEICGAIDEIYKGLEREILIFKARFENVQKEAPVHSDAEFSAFCAQVGSAYETFLRDYVQAKFLAAQKTALFFDRLNLKVAANYENAIKISVHFIKDKIDASVLSYEKDPLNFALFIPSAKEAFERVLTSLNLYEFENEMLGSTSFLNKILSVLGADFRRIKEEKISKIRRLSQRCEELKSQILVLRIP